MKAIYALAFVCMAAPALALDLDAPATEAPAIEFEYAAPIAPYGVYASVDESIDPTVDFTQIELATTGYEINYGYDYGFDYELTASIPTVKAFPHDYFPQALPGDVWVEGAYPY